MGRGHPRIRGEDRLTYLEELSRFACRARLSDLTSRARERTRWLVADTLPVIAAGMRQPEMVALCTRHLSSAGPGNAWVIGTGKRAGAMDAALLNGTAGTFLELNEGNLHAKGHPGIQVVPAAVALAQELGVSGERLLTSVAVGYEVCSRISRAARVRIEVHPHGTWGVIGAAVAAARIKGFDEPRMLELVNIASTMGMATSRQTLLEGATVRNVFTGHSGYMGIMAARLVESGFTGEKDSPAAVYGKVLSDGFDPAKTVEHLGREWLIELGYFKLHPTGRYVHSAIDALEDLLSRNAVEADRIKRIEVDAYRLAAMLSHQRVRSVFGARFSVPFALATILHHGGSSLDAFEAIDNESIQDLASRVIVTENKDYTARYPAEQRCDVRIILNDGKVLEGRCVVTKGEASKPYSAGELEAKFLLLGTPIWGEAEARRLLKGCLALEAVADFARFSEGFDL